ncbi:D-amino acid dehydrogenase [Alphaproteobacteria bacterium]|nr:D-amino acid dehydrogenase [Alphaproteobacteria bacterium]
MKNIAIIGAGITGITTAYQLLERGYTVSVFDKNRYAAMETSFANGGQLSACNAEVWNSWSTIGKGIKWMLKKDAPLLFSPKLNFHKIGWLLSFISNIPNHKKNTILTAKMAIESRNELKRILQIEKINLDLEEKGIMHLCDNHDALKEGRKVNKWLAEAGLNRKEVTLNEMLSIEPTLNLKNFVGGFYTKSDMSGDIHKFTKLLADACEKKGVKFYYETEITSVNHNKQQPIIIFKRSNQLQKHNYDGIVICAGVNSKFIANGLGDNVNIYPVKGYSITLLLNDKESVNNAPYVSLLDDKAKIVSSRLGKDRLRVAGTAEFNGYNRDIRADRINPLIKWCNEIFPNVSTEHAIPWAGLRPMTPSMVPKVGSGKLPGVFYNTGHGHLGWTLSALTSQQISDHIMRKDNYIN